MATEDAWKKCGREMATINGALKWRRKLDTRNGERYEDNKQQQEVGTRNGDKKFRKGMERIIRDEKRRWAIFR